MTLPPFRVSGCPGRGCCRQPRGPAAWSAPGRPAPAAATRSPTRTIFRRPAVAALCDCGLADLREYARRVDQYGRAAHSAGRGAEWDRGALVRRTGRVARVRARSPRARPSRCAAVTRAIVGRRRGAVLHPRIRGYAAGQLEEPPGLDRGYGRSLREAGRMAHRRATRPGGWSRGDAGECARIRRCRSRRGELRSPAPVADGYRGRRARRRTGIPGRCGGGVAPAGRESARYRRPAERRYPLGARAPASPVNPAIVTVLPDEAVSGYARSGCRPVRHHQSVLPKTVGRRFRMESVEGPARVPAAHAGRAEAGKCTRASVSIFLSRPGTLCVRGACSFAGP